MSDPIDRAIGGTTLDRSVKALQDVFVDHDFAEKGESKSDLISRQATIDALIDALAWTWSGTWSEKASIDAIKNLPSVDAVVVVRCVDCVHSDIFPKGADNDTPLKCLGIRYGGVMPNWYCEHAERKAE